MKNARLVSRIVSYSSMAQAKRAPTNIPPPPPRSKVYSGASGSNVL